MDFYEFNLYMIFKKFSQTKPSSEWPYQENRVNYIKGRFDKIREFDIVINYVVYPQKSLI